MRKIALALAFVPFMATAEVTECTMAVTDVRLTSGPGAFAGPNYLGHLSVKGNAFGGGIVPLCILDGASDTGKPLLGGSQIRVGAKQCDRWTTAAELALVLDMNLSLSYQASVQPDCENLVKGAYPFNLTVQKP